MINKEVFIQKIIKEINDLSNPKLNKFREDQIIDIMDIVIHNQTPKNYLVTDVNINESLKIYVYILTNNRLITVMINSQEEINTSSVLIRDMQKLVFKSPEPYRILVEIHLSNNSLIGMKYPVSKKTTTEFFQALDQVLV